MALSSVLSMEHLLVDLMDMPMAVRTASLSAIDWVSHSDMRMGCMTAVLTAVQKVLMMVHEMERRRAVRMAVQKVTTMVCEKAHHLDVQMDGTSADRRAWSWAYHSDDLLADLMVYSWAVQKVIVMVMRMVCEMDSQSVERLEHDLEHLWAVQMDV